MVDGISFKLFKNDIPSIASTFYFLLWRFVDIWSPHRSNSVIAKRCAIQRLVFTVFAFKSKFILLMSHSQVLVHEWLSACLSWKWSLQQDPWVFLLRIHVVQLLVPLVVICDGHPINGVFSKYAPPPPPHYMGPYGVYQTIFCWVVCLDK